MHRQKTFVNDKATLYLVATPIGNMSEFSPRAIEVLKEVNLIACEDTRTSKPLLTKFEIKTPLFSYHKFNEHEVVEKLIDHLKRDENVALISDAGYPLVSDPGSVLVNRVIEEGFNVSTISGPSAFLNALVASGLSLERFTFIGFLDSKPSARKRELKELADKKETLIFYEAPHRIKECLEDMLEVFGNRKIVLARELTKKFEEYLRGSIEEVITGLEGVKGEIVLIVEGSNKQELELDKEEVNKFIKKKMKEGATNKEIVASISKKYSLKRNDAYEMVCLVANKK